MLERLNVFLGGCGGKDAQDGDWIEMLNYDSADLATAYYYYQTKMYVSKDVGT